MKEIKLTQGKVSLVDDEDYEYLSQWKWNYNKYNYAIRSDRKNKYLTRMHRVIMNITDSNIQVDHINGNGLDNRKCNLRLCNKSTNGMNRGKTKVNSTGYKGVSKKKGRRHFRAYITVNKIRIHLGNFLSKEEAAKAYNEAALKYHKEFAYLNKI